MTTSKLTLYNGGLRLLGQRKLSTVTDSVESRRLLDDVYDEVVGFMLESGDWNFAGVTVAIESSDDVSPSFGYSFAVAKPDDWVRTVQVSGNGLFYPCLGPGEYVDEGAYWNCNVDPLYVRYVSNDTEAGLDLSMWPQTFVLAVEYELAKRIAPHLTSIGEDAKDRLQRDAKRALSNAKSKDAANQAPGRMAPGRLVGARGSSISRWPTER